MPAGACWGYTNIHQHVTTFEHVTKHIIQMHQRSNTFKLMQQPSMFTDMSYLITPEQPKNTVEEVMLEIEGLFSPTSPLFPSPTSMPTASPCTQHLALSPLVIPSYIDYRAPFSAPLRDGYSPFSETASMPSPTMRTFSPFFNTADSPTRVFSPIFKIPDTGLLLENFNSQPLRTSSQP